MLERLLFERIETRIMVGITMFVGIILMIGWVSINELGRMAAFERQYAARSIEHGAALYSSNCATCHGNDGRGILERAPALNNPQLFGFDYLAANKRERAALEAQQAALEAERAALADELVAEGTTAERSEEITARIVEIQAQLSSDNTEGIPAKLAALDAARGNFETSVQSAIDRGYDIERPARLENLQWAGDLHSFVYTTLVHGRPVSSNYWPSPMVSWSQVSGGPLRNDQLENLTTFILNWDKGEDWELDDLLAVQQFAYEPVVGEVVQIEAVGYDVAAIMESLNTVTGDPERGDLLYHGQEKPENGRPLNCYTCHVGAVNGPAVDGTWARAQNERLRLPEFAGYTGEHYLVESIILPNSYIVPNYAANVMPDNWGDKLTLQELADIVAYLQTQE